MTSSAKEEPKELSQLLKTESIIFKWAYHLKSKKINRIQEISPELKRWCQMTHQSIDCLNYPFLKGIEETILQFPELLPNLTSEKVLTSGAVAFNGAILLSLAETQTISKLDAIYHFTLLYMILDSFLDDPQTTSDRKKSVTHHLNQMINRPKDLIDGDPILKPLHYSLERILDGQPYSHPYLKKAYQSEVESSVYQTLSSLPGSFYLKLSSWKGGTTLQAIQAILGCQPSQSGYDLGICIQLIDDICDLEEDLEEKVNTIATHTYQADGNIDHLLFETINRIDQLSIKYNLFKPIMIGFVLHILSSSSFFSPSIKARWVKYSPIQKKTNLRSILHQELTKSLDSMICI
jgi:hypothetical protein